ncbi:flagellar basal body rod protein FlgB [Paenibacillus contaminans]|uniref:Flagellar basal body rod protein FlgB n=1 Tax=Paenibacillus contaminans TaxID=450362 RepID=A0A329MRV1_9BACL|nr:flagellar basal body rod protein FlgB [Paenibacillus contaminans]RAV22701.1 flagellar basal body rod protein FlgB [Paenibacillus contaminans]
MFLLNQPSLNLLERSLSASTLRQQVISNNIANVDTPQFKRSDVKFEEMLHSELDGLSVEGYRSDPRHFYIGKSPGVNAEIITDRQSVMNNSLNNVDIDTEMSLLAKNQLRYNVMIQQANHELKQFRTALEGRR